MSHVHWVYCAYILLSMSPPGVTAGVTSLGDAQRQLQQLLANQEKRRILQKLTQIGGVPRYQDELRQALAVRLIPWLPDCMRLTGAPWLRWSNI